MKIRPARLRGITAVCVAAAMSYGVWGHTATRPDTSPVFDSAGHHKSTKSSPLKALDIIVVVDNSGSMGTIIANFQIEFYNLVAQQIADGVDVRVIVVAKHGNIATESVCFESPLSSVPSGGCATPPVQPGITDLFKHYSIEVGSLDAWCLLISTYDGTTPDDFGLAPTGWSSWLREGAFKIFLVVSDDGVMCGSFDDDNSVAGGSAAAVAIDSDLLALSSPHFGTSLNRNYVVHSLVGITANAIPDDPWLPTSPVTTSQCPGAISPGTGHQGMSVLTDGLRFPACSTNDFDSFMDAVSEDAGKRIPLFVDGFESAGTGEWSSTVP